MRRIPTHRKRVDGRGVVTLNGRDFYTGIYGTPEAQKKYDRMIAEFLSNQRYVVEPASSATVAQLVATYQSTGMATDRRDVRTIPHLLALYADLPAELFTPVCYKTVRSRLMAENWTRQDINLCMLRVRRMFRYGVEMQMIPASVEQSLNCVIGLKRGQHREGRKVVPVDEQVFRTTVLFLPRTLRAVAELQWLTGARGGEILILRPVDIDMSGAVWTYRPTEHKTAHRDLMRVIYLGPQSQSVLRPFLNRPSDQYCFRPCDIRKRNGPKYSMTMYAALLRHACKRAEVTPWTSHQLRHAAGTRIRRDFGPDAAQVILGHQHMSQTEHYSRPAMETAIEAARKAG